MDIIHLFWSKVDRTNDCWEWLASKTHNGYGRFSLQSPKRTVRAHRYSLELSGVAIPYGMNVLHSCDNPGCVNPDHLFLGTQKDNMDDMIRKGRGKFGENHARSIFCDLDVWLIRQLCKTQTQQKISDWFNVSKSVISQIYLRKTWKHIA